MMRAKYMCYAIVCAWCKKTLELKGTTDQQMDGMTSHSICESCLESISQD